MPAPLSPSSPQSSGCNIRRNHSEQASGDGGSRAAVISGGVTEVQAAKLLGLPTWSGLLCRFFKSARMGRPVTGTLPPAVFTTSTHVDVALDVAASSANVALHQPEGWYTVTSTAWACGGSRRIATTGHPYDAHSRRRCSIATAGLQAERTLGRAVQFRRSRVTTGNSEFDRTADAIRSA